MNKPPDTLRLRFGQQVLQAADHHLVGPAGAVHDMGAAAQRLGDRRPRHDVHDPQRRAVSRQPPRAAGVWIAATTSAPFPRNRSTKVDPTKPEAPNTATLTRSDGRVAEAPPSAAPSLAEPAPRAPPFAFAANKAGRPGAPTGAPAGHRSAAASAAGRRRRNPRSGAESCPPPARNRACPAAAVRSAARGS